MPASSTDAAPTEPRQLLLIGCGNVGSGIATAFLGAGWRVSVVEPLPQREHPVGMSLLPHSIDDVPDDDLAQQLVSSHAIVYAAECGNRDEYYRQDALAEDNMRRFERFAERVARLRDGLTHIAYAGGSWTRRVAESQPDGRLVVHDESPAKPEGGENPYEKAKSAAQAEAAALAARLRLRISFWDWISVVPNYASNFTVAKMAAAALGGVAIRYSAGDVGRPLLSSADAGRALLLHTERRLASAGKAQAVPGCETLLVPGAFTPFRRFAEVVRDELAAARPAAAAPRLEADGGGAPACLAARCESARMEALGFAPDPAAVDDGLRATARAAIAAAR